MGALLLCVTAAILLLRFPAAAATGVSRGLAVCGEVIVPSLFPFLVLTGVFIRTGLAARVGRRLDGITRRLFGLPGCCGAVLLIGAVGGYPAGACAVRDLLDRGEIGRKEASHLLLCCVNGGPAFIIGTVGARLLGSAYKGVLLYIAHLAASFLIALFLRRRFESGNEKVPPIRDLPFAAALSAAVERAVTAVLTMSGFVLLFSAFLTLSEVVGITDVLSFPFTDSALVSAIYAAVFEVSCGCVELASCRLPMGTTAFLLGCALGFGGISVSAQIGGTLSDQLTLGRRYYLARGAHALLGGGLSALLFVLLPMPRVAVSAVAPLYTVTAVHPFSVSAAASAALLLLCGGVMLCTVRE